MKHNYTLARRLSAWMSLARRWKSLSIKFREGIDQTAQTVKKLNTLSFLLGVKKKVVLTAVAGLVTAGVQAQTFSMTEGVNNPFAGIDVGLNSSPVFLDLDGDGDLDLFSGEYEGTIKYYQNNGTNAFTEQIGINNPLAGIDVGDYSVPVFADLDGDGDLDLFTGEFDGTIKYYQNDGANAFTEQTGINNPFAGIYVDYYSTPVFEDLDGDGDLDLFSGEYDGIIKYYQNNGTNAFTEQTGVNNPLAGIDVGYYSVPVFADLDGDGDLDLFSGERNGTIKYYQNVTNAPTAIFSFNKPEQLSIYPNPASSVVNTEKGLVTIYDTMGNLVLDQESSGKIDVSSLTTGVYLITQDRKKTKLMIE